MSDHDRRPGFFWALPAYLFFAVFAVLPMVLVVVLSFTHWNGISAIEWAGGENWSRIMEDTDLRSAIWLTLLMTVVSWAVQTPMALGIGVWAAGKQRNRAVLSAIFFVPLLLSTTAIALTWRTFLDSSFGLPRFLQETFGFSLNPLGNESIVVWATIFVVSWQWIPFHTLLYQGAARGIPVMLYEAAVVDGAGRWRQFWSITLPQLRYTIVTSTILMLVGSITTFDTILVLTEGGPGTATRVLPLHMYLMGFSGFEYGYASAIAVIIVVIGAAISLATVRLSGFRAMQSQSEGL